MTDMVAHSAKPDRGVRFQFYKDHILAVRDLALSRVDEMLRYRSGDTQAYRYIVEAASVYHDLGKSDDKSQAILRGEESFKMINHVDAGVAALMKLLFEKKHIPSFWAAVLVESHHLGLLNKRKNGDGWKWLDRGQDPINFLRDTRDIVDRYRAYGTQGTVKDYIDAHIDEYIKKHESEVGSIAVPVFRDKVVDDIKDLSACTLRMLTSCLVDADHSDTAIHYGGQAVHFDVERYGLLPEQRLQKLREVAEAIPVSRKRIYRLRQSLLQDCLDYLQV